MGAREHHPQKSGNCDCAVTGTCVYVVRVTCCLPMRVTLRDAGAGTQKKLSDLRPKFVQATVSTVSDFTSHLSHRLDTNRTANLSATGASEP
ncbi:hypothetical protein RR48_15320 [Papilio machaon]|uniref:Uncharacterized protein n=1 Tax=Papilio machaon TaxID=76193 RepID=A0A194QV36_PAPMA|nr:hypothetical protein RR48_15320 [Papilio machaon]